MKLNYSQFNRNPHKSRGSNIKKSLDLSAARKAQSDGGMNVNLLHFLLYGQILHSTYCTIRGSQRKLYVSMILGIAK